MKWIAAFLAMLVAISIASMPGASAQAADPAQIKDATTSGMNELEGSAAAITAAELRRRDFSSRSSVSHDDLARKARAPSHSFVMNSTAARYASRSRAPRPLPAPRARSHPVRKGTASRAGGRLGHFWLAMARNISITSLSLTSSLSSVLFAPPTRCAASAALAVSAFSVEMLPTTAWV